MRETMNQSRLLDPNTRSERDKREAKDCIYFLTRFSLDSLACTGCDTIFLFPFSYSMKAKNHSASFFLSPLPLIQKKKMKTTTRTRTTAGRSRIF